MTSAWTDRHLAPVAAMCSAALTGGLVMMSPAPYHLWGMGAVILTVAVSSSLKPFGGMICGLLTAAALIAARQRAGQWNATDFNQVLAMTAGMIVLAWLTSVTGAQLRAAGRRNTDSIPMQARAAAAAFGSLGLLRAELAMARLNEEVARGQRHRRPLTIILLTTELTDPGLSPDARRAALRTVARLVETLVPETAVPFALAPDEVGAILPETDRARAWELLGPVVDAVGRASFNVRDRDERRSLVDFAELRAAIVEMSPQVPDADRLVAVARRTTAAANRTDWALMGTTPG